VWVTNVDSDVLDSRAHIEAAMAVLAEHNVNVVYPVVWNDAATMYPSAVMDTLVGRPIDPRYAGRDPLRELVEAIRAENRRDLLAICLAVPWQLPLFLTTMMVVTREWLTVALLTALLVALTVGLYFTWYRHLSVSDESAARVSAATADLSER